MCVSPRRAAVSRCIGLWVEESGRTATDARPASRVRGAAGCAIFLHCFKSLSKKRRGTYCLRVGRVHPNAKARFSMQQLMCTEVRTQIWTGGVGLGRFVFRINDEEATVRGFVSVLDRRQGGRQRGSRRLYDHIWGIDQVRVDVPGGYRDRLPVELGILVDRLATSSADREPDDHDVDVRLPTRLR